MSIVVFDFEGTTFNKCNVYDPRTWVCLLVLKVISNSSVTTLSFTKPWDVGRINEILGSASLLVGFNIKFDLSWARREFGFIPAFGTRIHDAQYAEFIFSKQTWKYPDLRTACLKREVTAKLDVVKEEYWDQGIDTDQVPPEILLEYCEGDVQSTYELYLKQMEMFVSTHNHLYKLFRLHMLDLPVLLEMEWNGLKYNKEKSLQLATEYDSKVKEIETKLNNAVNFEINWNSNNEKSAILYGGTVVREFQAPIGHYKTGARAGQVKYKTMEHPTNFPRLVQPLTTFEFGQKKEDLSVSEGVLRSLKPTKFAKHIIELILERSKLEKMNGTYLKGLPKKMDEFQWGEFLHPSYNQVVAVTGRVASSNPNGQNIPGVGKQLCESRF